MWRISQLKESLYQVNMWNHSTTSSQRITQPEPTRGTTPPLTHFGLLTLFTMTLHRRSCTHPGSFRHNVGNKHTNDFVTSDVQFHGHYVSSQVSFSICQQRGNNVDSRALPSRLIPLSPDVNLGDVTEFLSTPE